MSVEDRIECQSCGRAVVPQLWVDTRDRMSHPKVRHLCPLCGMTLRVSGGGINRGMLALVIGSFSMILLMLIFVVMKYGL